MRFLSLFSGIEAASVAWLPLGWECVGVAEIEPFPCAVLAHHYPGVPNLGSVAVDDLLHRAAALAPDVLVGGPPCQDFSVAGLRAGLDGDRGNLSLRWVQIINAVRPRFAVTENVPGWLSVNRGHAFGAFLAGLVGHDASLVPPKECGGRWTDAGMVTGPSGRAAWRTLDAQYFGLAQRRRRVFVVFCPGRRDDPAAVLFEPESLRGHPAPRREKGEKTAPTLAARTRGGGGLGTDFDCDGGLIARPLRAQSQPSHRADSDTYVAVCLNAHPSRRMGAESETFVVAPTLRAEGHDASEDGTGRGVPLVTAFTCKDHGAVGGGKPGQGYPAVMTLAIRGRGDSHNIEYRTDATANAVLTPNGGRGGIDVGAIHYASAVRRLTPRECERLQGFPDDYTRIRWNGWRAMGADETPESCRAQGLDVRQTKKGKWRVNDVDGPRYKALGNSFAVPVVRWIGRRIAMVEAAHHG